MASNPLDIRDTVSLRGVGSGVLAPGTVVGAGGFTGPSSVVGRTTGGDVRRLRTDSEIEKEVQKLLARQRVLGASSTEVQAPFLDIKNLQKRALNVSKKQVDPFFDKERQLFLKNIVRRRSNVKQEAELIREESKALLDEFLEDIKTTRERTGEDVEIGLEEIGLAEEVFQETEAEQAEGERTATAEGVAEAGLTTSGLGRQQVRQQEQQRRKTSGRTTKELDLQREERLRFKTRTFEDVAKGEDRRVAQDVREEKAIKAELDKQLGDIAFDKVSGLRNLETRRKERTAREASTQSRRLFTEFLSSLGGDTGKIGAANRAFGGLF